MGRWAARGDCRKLRSMQKRMELIPRWWRVGASFASPTGSRGRVRRPTQAAPLSKVRVTAAPAPKLQHPVLWKRWRMTTQSWSATFVTTTWRCGPPCSRCLDSGWTRRRWRPRVASSGSCRSLSHERCARMHSFERRTSSSSRSTMSLRRLSAGPWRRTRKRTQKALLSSRSSRQKTVHFARCLVSRSPPRYLRRRRAWTTKCRLRWVSPPPSEFPRLGHR
mmetsp:Transcript_87508/g.245742  ORF Transcript_87508/g.245742 Transcript_87508/m.245742 type:complete len:221 (-) Transcript_87508:252-914(-)